MIVDLVVEEIGNHDPVSPKTMEPVRPAVIGMAVDVEVEAMATAIVTTTTMVVVDEGVAADMRHVNTMVVAVVDRHIRHMPVVVVVMAEVVVTVKVLDANEVATTITITGVVVVVVIEMEVAMMILLVDILPVVADEGKKSRTSYTSHKHHNTITLL
jgi:hypothetical protein